MLDTAVTFQQNSLIFFLKKRNNKQVRVKRFALRLDHAIRHFFQLFLGANEATKPQKAPGRSVNNIKMNVMAIDVMVWTVVCYSG